jgi:hypothetical protein
VPTVTVNWRLRKGGTAGVTKGTLSNPAPALDSPVSDVIWRSSVKSATTSLLGQYPTHRGPSILSLLAISED